MSYLLWSRCRPTIVAQHRSCVFCSQTKISSVPVPCLCCSRRTEGRTWLFTRLGPCRTSFLGSMSSITSPTSWCTPHVWDQTRTTATTQSPLRTSATTLSSSGKKWLSCSFSRQLWDSSFEITMYSTWQIEILSSDISQRSTYSALKTKNNWSLIKLRDKQSGRGQFLHGQFRGFASKTSFSLMDLQRQQGMPWTSDTDWHVAKSIVRVHSNGFSIQQEKNVKSLEMDIWQAGHRNVSTFAVHAVCIHN